MYFVEFPVSTTNIFPLANSEAGGQLLSEWNIRSRESVGTDPSIKYNVGPSYTHSMDDFSLSCAASGASVDGTVIQISPGRAVVNGHYVESFTEINIDIANVNYRASQEDVPVLKGELAIGLVMMYSTYETLAASALPENEKGYYEGVRIVIVPVDSMRRPIDIPSKDDETKVNMHLLLGTFSYSNGRVVSTHDDDGKIKMFDASRIGDINSTLSDIYLSKAGLDPHHLYVFAGKGKYDDETGTWRDTWCMAEDSLMIWDCDATAPTSTVAPTVREATFVYDDTVGETKLLLPHKQIDGAKNMEGEYVYYPTKEYELPESKLSEHSGGVVGPHYNKRVLNISNRLDTFYRLPNGKMRAYIATLDKVENLPKIPIGTTDTTNFNLYTQTISDITSDLQDVAGSLSSITSNIGGINTSINRVKTTELAELRQYLDTQINNLTANNGELKTAIGKIAQSLSLLGPNGSGDSAGAEARINSLTSSSTSGLTFAHLDQAISDANVSDSDRRAQRIQTARTLAENIRGAVLNIDSQCLSTAMINLNLANSDISTVLNTLTICKNTVDTSIGSISTLLDAIIHDLSDINSSISEQITALGVIKTNVTNFSQQLEYITNTIVEEKLDQSRILTTTYWNPGDYVLVGSDATQGVDASGRYPSTMYVVNLGKILTISLKDTWTSDFISVTDENYEYNKEVIFRTVPKLLAGGIELDSAEIEEESQASRNLWDFTNYRGNINSDYFVARMPIYEYDQEHPTKITRVKWKCWYYSPTSIDTNYDYIIPPIFVTGQIPFATETQIGGFLDTTEDKVGYGYVGLDDEGHLRIRDYEFLSLGIYATQLGQDRQEGDGMDLATIQKNLEQYVNDRICYPNDAQIASASATGVDPHIINLYITLPSDLEGGGELKIHDIGSRYNSYLYVHILGSATSNTTIFFENCEKLRIDGNISGSPNIVIRNVNLYYDANVLDRTTPYITDTASIPTGIEKLNLWFERVYDSDPNLQVSGMTVTLLGDIEGTDNYDPWDDHNPNDNHYFYALRSLTFASDGSIIGVQMIVGDSSTANVIDTGKSLFRASFTLPQNTGLNYPVTKMTHLIKVSGTFVSCYYLYSEDKYTVKQTDFSALTQKYNPLYRSNESTGSIAFCTDVSKVSHITGVADTETVDCWDLHKPHIFSGASIE